MTSTSIEFYQRVVYVALKRMTEDRGTIDAAFRYWNTELSANDFDVSAIVQAVEDFIGLNSAEKKSFFIAMQAATNRMIDDLSPVPDALLSGGVSVNSSSVSLEETVHVSTNSAHYEVTVGVLRQFAQEIHRSFRADFDELKVALRDEAPSLVKDVDVARAFQNWADHDLGMLTLPKQISQDQCADTFHAFSMLASEFIGPVEVDRMVTNAVSDAMKMSEATSFDPRELVA